MDGEVGEVLVDSESMKSISAGGRHSNDKVWGGPKINIYRNKPSGILARRRKVPLISPSDHIKDNQENVMRERGWM